MDCLVRGNSIDGSIRVIATVTTDVVRKAREVHGTSATASAALGRLLTGAVIMGAQLKSEDDSITLQINGSGSVGLLTAVGDCKSRVRGYAENPFADLPPTDTGKLNVGGIVGDGYLSVIRDMGLKEPYIGRTPLVSGEIAEDLTYYYAKSEQIPTAIALGVLVNTDLSVIAAGGYMIQLMPEATEETADRLTENIGHIASVTDMITSGMSARDMAFAATDGFDMLIDNNIVTPAYKCRCSRRRMESALVSIGKKEVEAIIREQGEAEMCCRFCNKKYVFDKEQLEKICERAR